MDRAERLDRLATAALKLDAKGMSNAELGYILGKGGKWCSTALAGRRVITDEDVEAAERVDAELPTRTDVDVYLTRVVASGECPMPKIPATAVVRALDDMIGSGLTNAQAGTWCGGISATMVSDLHRRMCNRMRVATFWRVINGYGEWTRAGRPLGGRDGA